jgi:F0F1-type ATP synthase assembly protein I
MSRMPYRIVVVQILTAAVGTTVALFWDSAAAQAALLGAVSVIVPNALFAWRVATGVRATDQALDGARRALGQAVAKVVLTVVLMAMAFVWFKPAALPFFAMVVILQVAHGVAGAMAGPRRRVR